jgi:hypothetical protein
MDKLSVAGNRPGTRPVLAPAAARPPHDREVPLSHIVTIATELRDPVAVAAACRRLTLPEPVLGTARLYAGEAAGLLVRLPGWTYPAVIDPRTGLVNFDHYEGRWGDPLQLDRLLQAYAIEKARLEARKQGHSVTEQALPDGSIKLTISVGGVA